MKNIIMLVGEGDYPIVVYNYLIKNEFIIDCLIIEKSISRKRFLKRRIKKLGLMHVFGQILTRLFVVEYLKIMSRKRVMKIKDRAEFNNNRSNIDISIIVTSINSNKCQNLLKQINPDLVVVVNTRIVSKRILKSIHAKFINIHAGITPFYRGWHGGYWALVKGDIDNCGVTIHLVDEGIDTGRVLYQGRIDITKNDNYYTYPFLQLEKALPLLSKALKDILDNVILIESTSANIPSRLYSHPTIWEYILNRIIKNVK